MSAPAPCGAGQAPGGGAAHGADPGPLAGLRVLDFTHQRAGPYCTRLLAGFGADVLKVERPDGGDPLRHEPPFLGEAGTQGPGAPDPERGTAFHWLNAGKRSIVLDLKCPRGREVALRLAADSDLVVESFAPGVMARLGLGYEALSGVNPRLVMTSISSFGQTGPYRDFRADEDTLYAMSGAMVATGDPDRPPLAAGPATLQYTAGVHGYVASLVALRRARVEGRGEHVDVSIHESSLEVVEIHLAEFAEEGRIARRNGDQHPLVPWRCYPCRDGYVAVIGAPMRHWHRAAQVFDEPRLAAPELAHVGGRIERRAEVEALLRPFLETHDRREITERGQRAGFAFGWLASLAEARESPQHRARAFFRETDPHPRVGRLETCGAPFRVAGGRWRMGRAPLLGEHGESVLTERLGLARGEVERLVAEGAVGAAPPGAAPPGAAADGPEDEPAAARGRRR